MSDIHLPPRKPMVTATIRIDEKVVRGLEASLKNVRGVSSVHLLSTDVALSVWVGIAEDDAATRAAVYNCEDELSVLFPNVLFDFHVVPIPAGKTMTDFVSDVQLVFDRAHAA